MVYAVHGGLFRDQILPKVEFALLEEPLVVIEQGYAPEFSRDLSASLERS